MLQALQTTMSIDDLRDVLEIQEVHDSWREAARLNAKEEAAAEAARRRVG
jgi:hypothetical protein